MDINNVLCALIKLVRLKSVLTLMLITSVCFAQDDVLDENLSRLISIQQLQIERLNKLAKEQADLLENQANEIDTLKQSTKRLGEALRPDGSLWLKNKRVIDAGGGWHRSYGDTGWYNETHKGGWHMSDPAWIRSYGKKNVYVDKTVRADNGYQVDAKTVIDPDAGWHRSYGNAGWFNGTHGGGWHMQDNRWIRSYGNKDVYVNKVVRADNGFQVDGKQIIDGSGKVLVSPKYTGEFTWKQGQAGKRMKPTNEYACYLTLVSGKFMGGGEEVHVYEKAGWWMLGGKSQQSGIQGKARCVTFR